MGPVYKAGIAAELHQRLIHTGQHYDDKMSEVFFRDLQLPRPDANLGVGSGSHAVQTAKTMMLLEEDFLANPPSMVVVYGDINSTIAAALVAAKLNIDIAHVEAGLRSFDRTMPEEINRVLTDRISTLLFATSRDAVEHLHHEGVADEAIHFVGNPMIDTLLSNLDKMTFESRTYDFTVPERYVVGTLHRPGNVDDDEASRRIVSALRDVADRIPVVLPLHPRGRQHLLDLGLGEHPGIHIVEPLGYLDFIALVRNSSGVVTDSGGVQEETTVLQIPCFTLRPNTERPVTITHGTNSLVTPDSLVSKLEAVLAGGFESRGVPELWDGAAGPRIAAVLADELGRGKR